MAGKLSYRGAELALDAANGRATVTARTTYIMLLTSAALPGDTLAQLAAKEYSATGYARQSVAWGAAAGTPRTMENTNTLTYGPLTGATGASTITHWAEVSAASGTTGEHVAYGDLTASRTPQAGDSASYAPGALDIQID